MNWPERWKAHWSHLGSSQIATKWTISGILLAQSRKLPLYLIQLASPFWSLFNHLYFPFSQFHYIWRLRVSGLRRPSPFTTLTLQLSSSCTQTQFHRSHSFVGINPVCVFALFQSFEFTLFSRGVREHVRPTHARLFTQWWVARRCSICMVSRELFHVVYLNLLLNGSICLAISVDNYNSFTIA